jgi:NitT/TauT family transport system ATP-binding protein
VNGLDVTEPRQDVALMFQRPTLLPWRTALQNALLPPKLGHRLDEAAERQAYELLDLVGLGASSTPTRATSPAACSSAWRSPAS